MPDQREQLALKILNFCKDGKPEEKILGRFGGQGGVKIKELVQSLVKQGRLKSVNKVYGHLRDKHSRAMAEKLTFSAAD